MHLRHGIVDIDPVFPFELSPHAAELLDESNSASVIDDETQMSIRLTWASLQYAGLM